LSVSWCPRGYLFFATYSMVATTGILAAPVQTVKVASFPSTFVVAESA